MALHGGADGEGAYLLPDDADARPDGNNRIRLVDVLARLAKPPFQGKNVVLVLDATRFRADWPLGMIRNDFARALEGLDERVRKNPNLVVLSASGVDQRSWEAGELGAVGLRALFDRRAEGPGGGRRRAGRRGRAGSGTRGGRRRAGWRRTGGPCRSRCSCPRGGLGLERAARMELVVARAGRRARR